MATGFSLSGSGHWTAAGAEHHGHVFRGTLLDGTTLTLSLQMGEHLYDARLTSSDGEHFAGTWELTGGTGDVTATLYTSSRGYFLFGNWHESQKVYYWWFGLNKGDAIPGADGESAGTGADLLFP